MNDYYHKLRNEFDVIELNKKDLSNNPFDQFEKWFNDAVIAKIHIPNAMTLATSFDEVTIRTVLLKHFDKNGFIFFSNYNSKKAKQIQNNPQVALLFPWLMLNRQVKITGVAEKISTKQSLKYFITRPIESQISAWSSKQSLAVSSRQVLVDEFNKIKNKFTNTKIPLPHFWGGYLVKPITIEFWQGRNNRMHDRFIYQLINDTWSIKRLSP